jgi:hypothetical protein
VLAEVDAVDQQADQVQPRQVGGQQLGQGGVGHGDKPAGDRRLAGAGGGLFDLGADRLQPERVAAGR